MLPFSGMQAEGMCWRWGNSTWDAKACEGMVARNCNVKIRWARHDGD